MTYSSHGIDKDGKPFYRVYHAQKERTKTIKNEDGSVSYETFTPDPTFEDVTPESRGYVKVARYEDIILLKLPDAKNHYKPTPTLWHRIYEIDVEKYSNVNQCSFCSEKDYGAKYHYLKTMPQGVYFVCWCCALRFGRSSSGPIQTVKDIFEGSLMPYVKLVSDKKISKEEAITILNRLQTKPNIDVALYLEGSEFV